MLKNYFITAFAVLKRKKIFTAISLFGISITITVIVVIAALFENIIREGYPETNRNRCLYIFNLQEKSAKTGVVNKGSISYYFLKNYVNKLKIPEKIGISSLFSPVTTYLHDKKHTVYLKYSNADFFDVVKYDFLEGKPFTDVQVESQEAVAVITLQTKILFFGDIKTAVGRYIEIGNERYRVTGVVRDIPATMIYSYSNVILPFTFLSNHLQNKERVYFGPFTAILMGHSEQSIAAMKNEYDQLISRIPPESKEYDRLFSHADTYFESFTRPVFGERSDFDQSGTSFITVAGLILGFLFMLLPAINLVNINISRIMERSSEIAIRKAFGATRSSLIWQFLLENIIVSAIGGLIALLFSSFILYMVNRSALLPNTHLTIDLSVFIFLLLISIFFGVLSGVYPAFRMSKLEIAEGLKTK